MGKSKSMKDPFWERGKFYIPEGAEEYLAFFPQIPLRTSPILTYGESLNAHAVIDYIYRWLKKFHEDPQPEPDLKERLKIPLDAEYEADPFLYAAIFFETTCFLHSQDVFKLRVPSGDWKTTEKVTRLNHFFDGNQQFERHCSTISEAMADLLETGFSSEVYRTVQFELERLADIFAYCETFYPTKTEVGIFGAAKYEPFAADDISVDLAHECVFHFNIDRLVRMCLPKVSQENVADLLSFQPDSEDTDETIRRRINRVAKDGRLDKWFEERYRHIIKAIESAVESERPPDTFCYSNARRTSVKG